MTDTTGVSIVTTTVADEAAASTISRMLVENGLAACVQRLNIHSCYRWEGLTNTDPEVLLMIKTATDRLQDVVDAIRADHPYDLPEIIVLPVTGGLPAYLQWVRAETRADGSVTSPR